MTGGGAGTGAAHAHGASERLIVFAGAAVARGGPRVVEDPIEGRAWRARGSLRHFRVSACRTCVVGRVLCVGDHVGAHSYTLGQAIPVCVGARRTIGASGGVVAVGVWVFALKTILAVGLVRRGGIPSHIP